jgi:hypothetical protein
MANGVVRIGNGVWHLSQAKKWLKAGLICRVPGKLEWVFSNLPPDNHALLENLGVRIGNNLAFLINDEINRLVRFTHDLHQMTEGEIKFLEQQRLNELYVICVTKVLEELNTRGTPFHAILSEIDMQE